MDRGANSVPPQILQGPTNRQPTWRRIAASCGPNSGLPLKSMPGNQIDPPVAGMPESGPAYSVFHHRYGRIDPPRQRNPDPKRIVDEMIFGDYGTGARGGIGLHMDLLERYGFRGSFFVDVLMEYQFGREGLERTIDAILSRGHEVQLHVHDSHLAWSDDPALQSLSRGLLGKDADHFAA